MKSKKFEGSWHIQAMEAWDEDYFNMDVQAYIQIKSNSLGDFQFGLVSGQLDGEMNKIGEEEIFVFSWEGNDECDPASGCGWCRLRDENTIEGSIKLNSGDNSMFLAARAVGSALYYPEIYLVKLIFSRPVRRYLASSHPTHYLPSLL